LKTFLEYFLNNLTNLNFYCVNDPLLFPLLIKVKSIEDTPIHINAEFNNKNPKSLDQNKDFSAVICENISHSKIREIIFNFQNLIKDKDYSFEVLEVTAFLSSLFAFGSRISIIQFLSQLFNFYQPYEIIYSDFFTNINQKKIDYYSIPYYRWINQKIVLYLLYSLNSFYKDNGSIYEFLKNYLDNLKTKHNELSLLNGMIKFSNILFNTIVKISSNKDLVIQMNLDNNLWKIKDFQLQDKEMKIIKNLLPQSLNSTSAKRFNLFLKWMIRANYPDIGIWQKNKEIIFNQSNLFFPLDIHIIEISNILFKFLIEECFYFFCKENYLKNYSKNFNEPFPSFIENLNNLLNKKNYKEILKSINNRYDSNVKLPETDKNHKIINKNEGAHNPNETIYDFYLKLVELKDNSNSNYNLFINYLKKYEDFFMDSFKRKSIFMNKTSHLTIIRDFYKLFNEKDPLIFDLPLSIIRSPVLKDK